MSPVDIGVPNCEPAIMFRLDTRRRGPATRAFLVACLLSSVGCAARDGSRRGSRPWDPEAEGTTIGRDLRAAPRGTVAPATSLGVDLVESRRDRDATLSLADYEPGQPSDPGR